MKFSPTSRAAWLMCLAAFLCLLPAALHAQRTGYIQVTCAEPGVQVFLDGHLQGVTKADAGGYIIEDVPAGTHTVKVVKPGFNPQEAQVAVAAGGVFEYRVRSFTPVLEVSQQGESAQQQVVQKVGGLLIQTLPVSCVVTIESLAACRT
jgi:hypothetical protein